ncbi:enolase C-terminal domain-like protein [Cumulibacter soli]|uniref:enolase C-terminal domain-like protein n=1 Tax=Cumulibacter soli TaxID=2546344 RepID=UPI0010681C48|nr:enolase C-terminal domain-like protein [Cumulibacter soli]
MKITSLKARVVNPPDFEFRWRDDIPPVQNTMTVFEIETEDGITGVSTSWVPSAPTEIAETAMHFFAPLVVGADVYDRERIWQEMMSFQRYTITPKAASCIDIALWDIAARAADLPLYKFLGSYRHTVPAYATTQTQPNVDGYVQIAQECQSRGITGVKIHADARPDADILVCEAVREAVGDDYKLMLDATSAYDYQDALRVGRAIESLGFHWFEDPMRDDDVAGFVELCRALDIPVLMGESQWRGIWTYSDILARGAADAIRVVADVMGGITGMRKVGALAESHNRRLEPHAYGSTLVQAAHLHHLLSSRNAEMFEMPYPIGPLDFGMLDTVEVTDEGMVIAPSKPGLGYEVDWDAIDDRTVKCFG